MTGNAQLKDPVPPGPDAAPDTWALSPLPPALAAEARGLVDRLDARQRWWLAGYLAGAAVREPALAAADRPAGADSPDPAVTVLFGTHTGNSERLARALAERLTERGVRHTLLDMLECRKSHLAGARTLLAVVSTHGDGDPPERAQPLFELLEGRKAPRLEHLKFSVLALGDSSYEKFCEAGRRLDARLEALGATRVHARVECDVDFDAAARAWIDSVLEGLEPATAPVRLDGGGERRHSVANAYTRKNPFPAPVLANQSLTGRGSTKDVRHLELSIEGANLHYEPGDAIGVVAVNREADVAAVLERLPFDPDASVGLGGQAPLPLRAALRERLEIGPVTPAFLERYAAATGADALARADREALARYARERHLVDVLAAHPPHGLDPLAFASLLRPLAPRLYSIASSQRETPDEVHLTVAVVAYRTLDRDRRGLVSGQLALAGTGEPGAAEERLPIYLHRNPGFRLPADPAASIVMIGPGTGIAPFRAFIAERAALGATGRHWLFFGDRSFENDFLYQTELLAWRKRGVLSRLDVAFSRDQEEKIYVQHHMRAQGAELWRWLEGGAHLYVCGDAQHMAPDVHAALLAIVERHGGKSADAAAEYLLELQRARRYQRDVY